MPLDIAKYFTKFFPVKSKKHIKKAHLCPESTGGSLPSPQSSQEITICSRRKEDMSAEAQLAIYLDKYLYERFPTKEYFEKIERVYDKQRQLQGIDVQFICRDGKIFNIDEKAQLYYLNQNIPTFAFELSFLRNGIPTIGWFCNDSLKTDMYLLMSPFASCDHCSDITWDKFTKVECLLIKKEKLISLLCEHGLSPEVLIKKAGQIRRDGECGKILIPNVHGIYYYASDPKKYKEAPINIVIYKGLLRAIAQRRYIVTPKNVEFM